MEKHRKTRGNIGKRRKTRDKGQRRENRGMHRKIGKLLYILGTYYGVLHEILTLKMPLTLQFVFFW